MPLASQCDSELGLYTTIDCDKIAHSLPVTLTHQQWAPAFDVKIGLDVTCWVVHANDML